MGNIFEPFSSKELSESFKSGAGVAAGLKLLYTGNVLAAGGTFLLGALSSFFGRKSREKALKKAIEEERKRIEAEKNRIRKIYNTYSKKSFPIGMCFGTVKTDGNIIFSRSIDELNNTVSRNVIIALGEGKIADISKINFTQTGFNISALQGQTLIKFKNSSVKIENGIFRVFDPVNSLIASNEPCTFFPLMKYDDINEKLIIKFGFKINGKIPYGYSDLETLFNDLPTEWTREINITDSLTINELINSLEQLSLDLSVLNTNSPPIYYGTVTLNGYEYAFRSKLYWKSPLNLLSNTRHFTFENELTAKEYINFNTNVLDISQNQEFFPASKDFPASSSGNLYGDIEVEEYFGNNKTFVGATLLDEIVGNSLTQKEKAEKVGSIKDIAFLVVKIKNYELGQDSMNFVLKGIKCLIPMKVQSKSGNKILLKDLEFTDDQINYVTSGILTLNRNYKDKFIFNNVEYNIDSIGNDYSNPTLKEGFTNSFVNLESSIGLTLIEDDIVYIETYTENPIHIARYILENQKIGMGINKSYINEEYFIREGLFCQEPANDGVVEPRYSCNIEVSGTTTYKEFLNQLMDNCNGVMYEDDGQIKVILDKFEDQSNYPDNHFPIVSDFKPLIFGNGDIQRHPTYTETINVDGGDFTSDALIVSGTTKIYKRRSSDRIANQTIIYKSNPELINNELSDNLLDWPSESVQVLDPLLEKDETFKEKKSVITINSITSKSQALRRANFELQYRNYDIFHLEFIGDKNFAKFELFDKIRVYCSIFNGQLFKIMQLTENSDNTYNVIAIQYVENAYVDNIPKTMTFKFQKIILPYNSSLLEQPPLPKIPAVGNYLTEVFEQNENGMYGSKIQIKWDYPNYPRKVKYNITVEYQDGVDVKRKYYSTANNIFTTDFLASDYEGTKEYTVAIQAENDQGTFSNFFSDTITLLGYQGRPANVTTFTYNFNSSLLQLSWDAISDGDVKHYKIKRILSSAPTKTWETASNFAIADTNFYEERQFDNTEYDYFIKAVNFRNIESLTATQISDVNKNVPINPSNPNAQFLSGGDSKILWNKVDEDNVSYDVRIYFSETARNNYDELSNHQEIVQTNNISFTLEERLSLFGNADASTVYIAIKTIDVFGQYSTNITPYDFIWSGFLPDVTSRSITETWLKGGDLELSVTPALPSEDIDRFLKSSNFKVFGQVKKKCNELFPVILERKTLQTFPTTFSLNYELLSLFNTRDDIYKDITKQTPAQPVGTINISYDKNRNIMFELNFENRPLDFDYYEITPYKNSVAQTPINFYEDLFTITSSNFTDLWKIDVKFVSVYGLKSATAKTSVEISASKTEYGGLPDAVKGIEVGLLSGNITNLENLIDGDEATYASINVNNSRFYYDFPTEENIKKLILTSGSQFNNVRFYIGYQDADDFENGTINYMAWNVNDADEVNHYWEDFGITPPTADASSGNPGIKNYPILNTKDFFYGWNNPFKKLRQAKRLIVHIVFASSSFLATTKFINRVGADEIEAGDLRVHNRIRVTSSDDDTADRFEIAYDANSKLNMSVYKGTSRTAIIGDLDDSDLQGGWFDVLGAGGTKFSDAPFKAIDGNVYIDGSVKFGTQTQNYSVETGIQPFSIIDKDLTDRNRFSNLSLQTAKKGIYPEGYDTKIEYDSGLISNGSDLVASLDFIDKGVAIEKSITNLLTYDQSIGNIAFTVDTGISYTYDESNKIVEVTHNNPSVGRLYFNHGLSNFTGFQVEIKRISGSGNINIYDGTEWVNVNDQLQENGWATVYIADQTDYGSFNIQFLGTGVVQIRRYLIANNFSYKTSWVEGGTTRPAGSLQYSTDVLNKTEGSILLKFKPKFVQDLVNTYYIFETRIDSLNNRFALLYRDGGKFQFFMNSHSRIETTVIPAEEVQEDKKILITYNSAGVFKMFYNGIYLGTYTDSNFTFDDVVNVGFRVGSKPADSIFKEIIFFNKVLTDDESIKITSLVDFDITDNSQEVYKNARLSADGLEFIANNDRSRLTAGSLTFDSVSAPDSIKSNLYDLLKDKADFENNALVTRNNVEPNGYDAVTGYGYGLITGTDLVVTKDVVDGGIAVESAKSNKIETEGLASQDWTAWTHWNNTTYWSNNVEEDDEIMGKVFKGTKSSASLTYLFDYNIYALTQNQYYTISIWIKSDVERLSGTVRGYIRDSGGTLYYGNPIVGVYKNYTKYTFTIQYTGTTTATTGGIGIEFVGLSTGDVIYAAYPQLESGKYATSFVKGSRNFGKLSYPTSVLNKEKGSIRLKFKPNFNFYDTGFAKYLFDSAVTGETTSNYLRIIYDVGDERWKVEISDNSFTETRLSDIFLTEEEFQKDTTITLTYSDTGEVNFYMNGKFQDKFVNSFNFSEIWNSLVRIGCSNSFQAGTESDSTFYSLQCYDEVLTADQILNLYNRKDNEDVDSTALNYAQTRIDKTGLVSRSINSEIEINSIKGQINIEDGIGNLLVRIGKNASGIGENGIFLAENTFFEMHDGSSNELISFTGQTIDGFTSRAFFNGVNGPASYMKNSSSTSTLVTKNNGSGDSFTSIGTSELRGDTRITGSGDLDVDGNIETLSGYIRGNYCVANWMDNTIYIGTARPSSPTRGMAIFQSANTLNGTPIVILVYDGTNWINI